MEKQNDIIATKHKNQVEGNKHLRKQLGGEVVAKFDISYGYSDSNLYQLFELYTGALRIEEDYKVIVIKQKGE